MEKELKKSKVRSGISIPEFISMKREEIIASMKRMNVNDYIDVDLVIKTQYYSFAKKAGIKITVRLLNDGFNYGCWRV